MTNEEKYKFNKAKKIRDGKVDYKILPLNLRIDQTKKNRTIREVKELKSLKSLIDKFIPKEFSEKYSIYSIDKRCRKRELTSLKHIFSKIAFDNNYGCMSIGILIYQDDHASPYNGLNKANNYIKTDPEFKELYLKILNEYNGSRFNEHLNTKQNIT